MVSNATVFKLAERRALNYHLMCRHLDPSSERGRILSDWLWDEIDAGVPSPETQLAEATEIGLAIYECFQARFDDCYMVNACLGEQWVKAGVRKYLGLATEPLVEAVLQVIRDKRLHLLMSFREKYQRSLFAAVSFDAKKVAGYLKRVADIESRKAPLHELRRKTGDPSALNQLPSPFGFVPNAEAETEETWSTFESAARRLAAFWKDGSRFKPVHYLEGMATVGLGWMTDEPLLVERSKAYLAERQSALEPAQSRLAESASRLLDRHAMLEAKYRRNPDADVRAKLDKARKRLDGLRSKREKLLESLFPQPRRVAKLLDGLVSQKLGTVRFNRIDREIEILASRVARGAKALRTERSLPPEVDRLIVDVLEHARSKPSAVGARGISQGERISRSRLHDDWRAAGGELLERVREARDAQFRHAELSSKVFLGWLFDVLDLHEFGLYERDGIVVGLKTRRGARLNWLLRPELEGGSLDPFAETVEG